MITIGIDAISHMYFLFSGYCFNLFFTRWNTLWINIKKANYQAKPAMWECNEIYFVLMTLIRFRWWKSVKNICRRLKATDSTCKGQGLFMRSSGFLRDICINFKSTHKAYWMKGTKEREGMNLGGATDRQWTTHPCWGLWACSNLLSCNPVR